MLKTQLGKGPVINKGEGGGLQNSRGGGEVLPLQKGGIGKSLKAMAHQPTQLLSRVGSGRDQLVYVS